MADSLVLTGVKDVRKHTGTEMLRRTPKGGGDTFQLKRWWVEGGISTCYEDATVFDVTTGTGTVKLALATSMSTNVRIDHDGSFNFTFIGSNELSRAALFTDTFELIEHYVLPSISGGKVMTVTPAGAASRPNAGPPATSIGTVTVAGDSSPTDGDTKNYTVTVGGDASGLTYAWSVDASGTVSGSATGSSVNIVWAGTSASTVTCDVNSSDAGVTDNPKSGTLSVTPDPVPETLTAVEISGADSASDGDTETYTASKTGTATDVDYVYTSDVPEDTISNGAVTFDGVGEHVITVTGTSSNAGTSKTDSVTVTIS